MSNPIGYANTPFINQDDNGFIEIEEKSIDDVLKGAQSLVDSFLENSKPKGNKIPDLNNKDEQSFSRTRINYSFNKWESLKASLSRPEVITVIAVAILTVLIIAVVLTVQFAYPSLANKIAQLNITQEVLYFGACPIGILLLPFAIYQGNRAINYLIKNRQISDHMERSHREYA